MDPDEALRLLIRAAKSTANSVEGDVYDHVEMERLRDAALDMLEHFEALDGWLSKGGFLPNRWAADRRGAVLHDIEEDE